MRYEWHHITAGLIGSKASLDELIELMEEEEYGKPNIAKLREGLKLNDEYEYFSGVFKVKKIRN